VGIEEWVDGLRRERVGWKMKKAEPIKMPTRMKRRRCSLKR
jgi:hypothetical protein